MYAFFCLVLFKKGSSNGLVMELFMGTYDKLFPISKFKGVAFILSNKSYSGANLDGYYVTNGQRTNFDVKRQFSYRLQ